jgi:hypothetical protein
MQEGSSTEQLRVARALLGWSRNRLAAAAGVGPRSVARVTDRQAVLRHSCGRCRSSSARHLQNILPKRSALISEALSVTGRGYKLFELMCAHDLEGVVAKLLKEAYGSRV